MKLLDAVVANTVGTAKKIVGPTTIFVESTNFSGGTVTVYVYRNATSPAVSSQTFTASGVMNDNIIGLHYVSATLAGCSGTPAALTVATPG